MKKITLFLSVLFVGTLVAQQLTADEVLRVNNFPDGLTINIESTTMNSGGPCDFATEITSGNIVNEPLICGAGDFLNNGNFSPFCMDEYGPGGIIPPQYGDGIEATYTYTPSSTGTATLTVDETIWSMIQVFENGCPLNGGVCIAGARSITDIRTVSWEAQEGVEYFIWIDSWPAPASPCVEGGQMTFSGPEPATGGGDCTSNSITTAFTAGNQFAGNMFDITASGDWDIEIEKFDINIDEGTANISVFSRLGSYVGFENDPAGWTLMGTEVVTGLGENVPTELNVGGLIIPEGETYGIYITVSDHPSVSMFYTNGDNVYSDANVTVTTGAGKGAPDFTGSTWDSRSWNGTVYYCSNEVLSTNDNTIDGFTFYPNPTMDILNLRSNISIDNVELFNMLGQKVIYQVIGATTFQVDVSKLATGTYLMKVSAEGQTATYQVIKK